MSFLNDRKLGLPKGNLITNHTRLVSQ